MVIKADTYNSIIKPKEQPISLKIKPKKHPNENCKEISESQLDEDFNRGHRR